MTATEWMIVRWTFALAILLPLDEQPHGANLFVAIIAIFGALEFVRWGGHKLEQWHTKRGRP